MIRTQIQLTEEQARELRERARIEDRSMADLVRESVTEYLVRRRPRNRESLRARALALSGAFRSGTPDLAAEHDHHLAEDYDSSSKRS